MAIHRYSRPHSAWPATAARGAGADTALRCSLWMIDPAGATALPCHCLESFAFGMRLRVPVGYGIAVGQRYELSSHRPGERLAPGATVIGNAWVTIVQARILLDEETDQVDVHAVRVPLEKALRWSA